MTNNNKLKGVLAILMAMFLFTSLKAIFKTIEGSYAETQLVFLRNLFALIPYIIMFVAAREKQSLKIENISAYFIRALLSVIGLGCLFKSLTLLPLADATTLSYVASLIIVLLAVPLLGEKITKLSGCAVILGFIGVMFIAKPTGEILNLGIIFALLSATIRAFIIVQGRQLTVKNSNAAIVLYPGLFACLISGLPLPFVWQSPTPYDLLVLSVIGIGGGIAHYLVTIACRHAPARLLSPMHYSSLLWTLIYGIFIFGEIPTISLYIGGGLIIFAGLMVMYQEKAIRC